MFFVAVRSLRIVLTRIQGVFFLRICVLEFRVHGFTAAVGSQKSSSTSGILGGGGGQD